MISGDGLTLPRGVIAVLEGEFGELGLAVLRQSRVREFQFAKEHGQRPAIAGRVSDGRLLLDLYAVDPADDETLVAAVLAVASLAG